LIRETASGVESLGDKAEEFAKKMEDSKYGETVKKAASSVGNIGESFSKTFENIKNIEFTDKQSPEERMEVFTDAYVSPNYTPVPIRMRKEVKYRDVDFDADTEAEGVTVHKDYTLYERYKESAMGQRMDDLGTRINASDNAMVRGFAILGQRTGGMMRKLTSNSYNDTIKAIRQVDKKFDQEAFVQFLESEMIPIILEAKAINDVAVIEDWCLDAPAQRFAIKHREQAKNKITYYEKTINLQKLEILDGTVHDNMPAFQISFETNTLMAYTDKDGNVIEQEGYPKPDEVYKSYHVWSVCRDPMEPEPSAAWRVLECETMDQKLAF